MAFRIKEYRCRFAFVGHLLNTIDSYRDVVWLFKKDTCYIFEEFVDQTFGLVVRFQKLIKVSGNDKLGNAWVFAQFQVFEETTIAFIVHLVQADGKALRTFQNPHNAGNSRNG